MQTLEEEMPAMKPALNNLLSGAVGDQIISMSL
jgi:hypothetical protein